MTIKQALLAGATALVLAGTANTAAFGQASEFKWAQGSFRDGQTGRTVSTLMFGIPETDAVQFAATCQAGPSGATPEVHIATDIGKLNDGARIKVNPLAHWSREDVSEYITNNRLPRHPKMSARLPSLGCAPCTSEVEPGEAARAGRWRGQAKTECGIHFPTHPTDG